MPDYQETQVAGKSWRRCYRVLAENPLGGTPAINYAQQDVVQLDGGEHIARDAGLLVAALKPGTAGKTFPLLNPATGEVVGSMSEAQLFAALHSHFLFTARQQEGQAGGGVGDAA